MNILFVGGGSIGHVAPCVAVWRAVERAAEGSTAHFVCSERPEEAEFLRKENVAFTPIAGRRLSVRSPMAGIRAFGAARAIIKRFRPDAVFSKGGALSIPVALAARLRGIPVVLHESDAVSGRANKMVSRWAKVVCFGFPNGKHEIRNPKSEKKRPLRGGEHSDFELRASGFVFTGNPIRPDISDGSRERGCAITGFSGDKPVLFVLGGSQGAAALNEAVHANLDRLRGHVDIIHLTGPGKTIDAEKAGYWRREFAHDTLPHLYALADIALSRAGAGTLGELAVWSIPTLLVPLRGLAQDHQMANAAIVEASGGGKILDQEALATTLVDAVADLARDRSKRAEMGRNMGRMAQPEAGERIAEILLACRKGTP